MAEKTHRPQICVSDMNKLQTWFAPDYVNPPSALVFHRLVLYLDQQFDKTAFDEMMKQIVDADDQQ